jgi:hypothetical protein
MGQRGRNEGIRADDDAAEVCRLSSAPTALCGKNKRFNQRPLLVRRVAGVAQFIAIASRAIFNRPHRRPSTNQLFSLGLQVIHPTQQLFKSDTKIRSTTFGRHAGGLLPRQLVDRRQRVRYWRQEHDKAEAVREIIRQVHARPSAPRRRRPQSRTARLRPTSASLAEDSTVEI